MSKTVEEWRPIQGYEGLYEVSDWGRVKSLDKIKNGSNQFGRCIMYMKGKILKLFPNTQGRMQVDLKHDGERKTCLVHVLVAQAFIPNPEGYTNIHHIDGVKTNNNVENLIWMDESEHKAMHAAKRFSKKVYQYTLDDELVKIWNSTNECDRNGFSKTSVSYCCRKKYWGSKGNNIYKGYKWSYEPL